MKTPDNSQGSVRTGLVSTDVEGGVPVGRSPPAVRPGFASQRSGAGQDMAGRGVVGRGVGGRAQRDGGRRMAGSGLVADALHADVAGQRGLVDLRPDDLVPARCARRLRGHGLRLLVVS